MTESEWLTCTDPTPMLAFLRGKASDRKLRFFACACCRRIWHLLIDQHSKVAVELAEQCADGQVAPHQLPPHYDAASNAATALPAEAVQFAAARAAADAARSYPPSAKGMMARAASATAGAAAGAVPTEPPAQAVLLREIVGNPFRPYAKESSWLTPIVQGIAEAIYREQTFDRLPILADALEEAGCNHTDILNHFRQPGGHVRGCWCLDLILAKE